MPIDQAASRRISIIRFVMIFGVVLLHTPPSNGWNTGTGSWFDLFQAFFQSALFRTTVPVLTFLSAYLLFASRLDLDPVRLYKKKLRTLVLPFIALNGAVLLGVYLVQRHAGLALLYPVYLPDASVAQWADAALGYQQMPINYPLNFLRDLIILAALAPLFGILLRNFPIMGLLFVVCAFMNNFDGALVLRNNMSVMFYLGGLAAVSNINIKALDQHAGSCFVLLVVICAAMVTFGIRNFTYLGVIAPVLVWPATRLIDGTRAGQFLASLSKYAFFIYIAHAPLVAVSARLYPEVQYLVPLPLYWLMTPLAVCAVLIAVYELAMRVAPTTFGLIIGRKSARPAQTAKVARHQPVAAV